MLLYQVQLKIVSRVAVGNNTVSFVSYNRPEVCYELDGRFGRLSSTVEFACTEAALEACGAEVEPKFAAVVGAVVEAVPSIRTSAELGLSLRPTFGRPPLILKILVRSTTSPFICDP